MASEISPRVLIIHPHMIMPSHDTGSMRLSRIIQALCTLACRVTFAFDRKLGLAIDAAAMASGRALLEGAGVRILTDTLDAAWWHKHGPDHDLIVFSHCATASRHAPMARVSAPAARLVFDTVDVSYLRLFRMARARENVPALRAAVVEKQAFARAVGDCDLAVVVSDTDAAWIRADMPGANLHVIGSRHDVVMNLASRSARTDVMFLGNYYGEPNRDAAAQLLLLWPSLELEFPRAHLLLCGAFPHPGLLAQESARIEVPGFVQDMDPWFARARVFVAPLRFGSGIKGKVLDAMAHGVPVVMSTIAAEGLNISHRVEAMIADTDVALVDAVRSLYGNDDLWQKLSERGLAYVARAHDASTLQAQVRAMLEICQLEMVK